MRNPVIFFALTVSALTAALANAQPAPATVQMPRWDSGFSLGMISNAAKDEGSRRDDASEHFEGRLELGRYWTDHLKTDVAVSFLNGWSDYDYEPRALPGGRDVSFVSITKSLHMTTLTPTFTYQFLENEFAHPYVSAGVRVGFLDVHSTRYEYPPTSPTGFVPGVEDAHRMSLATPVVSAGFKSYFHSLDARTFMRTEISSAFDRSGQPHLGFRIGFGVDF